MFDILVYLFENCQQADLSHDQQDRVAKKLSAAGFEDSDISEALTWLAGVVRGAAALARAAARIAATRSAPIAPKELAKLDAECRGFLLIYLEHSGILTPQTREHVIERALAADGDGFRWSS